MAEHRMNWDGPFGGVYIERCACGWMHNTFAATRETGIGKAHDAHLAEVAAGVTQGDSGGAVSDGERHDD